MIAPAFPLHGRITRGGRQFSLAAGASEPFGDDIRATLVAQGIPVEPANRRGMTRPRA